MIKKIILSIILFIPAITFAATPQQELSQLQNSINKQQKTINNQKKTRTILLKELEFQEKSIAKVGQTLHQNEKVINKFNEEMTTVDKKIKTLEKRLSDQKKILEEQLESAFKIGKNSGVELMFNAKESERNDRIITYFSYITQVRQQVIDDIKDTQKQLSENQDKLNTKIKSQQKVIKQKKQEQKKLAQYRVGREKTLTALDSSLEKNQQRLQVLKQNEAKLQTQIAKAKREARARAEREAKEAAAIKRKQKESDYRPTSDELSLMARAGGLGRPANRYNWPVNGRLLQTFGSRLQGELFWKGMVIGAKAGTSVKAIAEGRVILASWLQGYGFMVVIEHGKNDMSLYGYNQSVNVKVNDNVKAGQTIALIGDSGGQKQPALYFEIRRNGKALNPQAWLIKK